MKKKIIYTSIFIILLFSLSGQAQEKTTVLTKVEKEQAIEKICQLLNRFYVFPEVATQMEEHIKTKLTKGAFEKVTDPDEFVNYMTKELRSICHDKHLGMYIGSNPEEQTKEDQKLERVNLCSFLSSSSDFRCILIV